MVRFVKALGFSSYKEFKYRLIEEGAGNKEEGNRRVLYGYEITSGDDRKNIPSRIVATTIQMLEETLKSISTDTFERIIEGILKAKAIEICGVENSQTVCSDLCIKLNYLGLNCNYYQDSYMQRIRAGQPGTGRPGYRHFLFRLLHPGTVPLRGRNLFPYHPGGYRGYDLSWRYCKRL